MREVLSIAIIAPKQRPKKKREKQKEIENGQAFSLHSVSLISTRISLLHQQSKWQCEEDENQRQQSKYDTQKRGNKNSNFRALSVGKNLISGGHLRY